jgi:choice-of-anchor A domain-containing protein
MIALTRIRERRRSSGRGPGTDAGLTLVELVISVVLGAVLMGVVTSILLTSMSVVDRTSEISHDATDAGLIAAFLYRDAQAAGGSDPETFAAVPGLGVSTTDWGGCEQDGGLVLRLSWIDRLDLRREHPMTVTWALLGNGVLNRRACQDGEQVDVALGEHVSAATAACEPDEACGPETTTVRLDVTGSARPEPVTFSLSANLRVESPAAVEPSGVAAPLLVLGGDVADCPELTVGSPIVVLGDGVIDGLCGATAIDGDASLLDVTGQLTSPVGTVDLYADRIPAAPTCAAATDPALGASPSADSTLVYTNPVAVTGAVTMQPGRYVFCQGLELQDGSRLTGTDVTLQVVGGDVTVAAAATIDLTAPATGDTANLLLTIATGDLTIEAGTDIDVLAGVVHVPSGTVRLGSDSSVSLGAVVADQVVSSGTGVSRFGLPIPRITIEPIELAPAQVAATYPSLALIADLGTGPYSWRAAGLPPGLSMTTGGLLTGTPTAAGTSTVTFTVTDATGQAAVATRPLVVKPALTVGSPASLSAGQVGSAYSATIAGAGGTPPYRFTATGLPAGLVLGTGGSITGTPTAAGTSTVAVTVTDAVYATAVRTYTLTVRAALVVTTTSIPNGTAGSAYAATSVAASGGLAPYTFSAVGLPAGMAMSSAGAISGTPAAAGTYTIDVTVTDASGATARRSLTISIIAAGTDAKPFARAARFQVLTEGNALLGTWEIQGSAAVGGNVTLRNYQTVATKELSTVTAHAGGAALGLLVGGQVDLAASGAGSELRVEEGWFVVGSAPSQSFLAFGNELHLVSGGITDNWTTPRVRSDSSQTSLPASAAVVPNAFPFANTFTELRSTSTRLATLAPATCAALAKPSVTEAYGNHTLTLTAGRVNVLNLTVAELTAMNNVAGPVLPGANTPLVINVTDSGSVTFPVRYWDLLKDPTSVGWILWNFPNATSIAITQSFYGSLLAPNAAVSMVDVNVVGEVVTKTLDFRPWSAAVAHFDVTIPCLGSGAPYVATPGKLSSLQAGVAMTPATFTVGGGTPTYTWSASGLPAGLAMSTSGVLSGTPTTAGTHDFTARVTDSLGSSGTRVYRLVVAPAPTIAAPTSLAAGQVGVAYRTAAFTPAGGTSPYTWSAIGLPAGLTMSSAGVISGTPTVETTNGAATVTVTVRDATSTTATRTYSLFVAAASVPAGCPLDPAGWRAEYYANVSLSGAPGLCRDDAAVSFNWAGRSPGGSVPATNFSVRWTRRQAFEAATYRFTVGSDDGIRVYVDGVRVIDDWNWQVYTAADHVVDLPLTAGHHTVVVEYFQAPGQSRVELTWAKVAATACGTATTASWLGQYYANATLTGSPAMCRNDSNIDFNWGSGSPQAGTVPGDRFSVRWTRIYEVASPGTYRIRAGSDDGVRVYVDGVRVINSWSDRSYGTTSADVWISAGTHTVVYEFYENGGLAVATLSMLPV